MPWTLILTILKKNWLPICLGLIVLGTLSYIKVLKVERDHYHSQANQIAKRLALLIVAGDEQKAQLEKDKVEIEAKYRNTLKDANDLIISNAKANEENIRNAKELHDVKLSLDAVRLFNSSKQSSPADTKPGNVAEAPTTQEAPVNTSNLQEMLLVVNYNDAEHLKCIKQVTQWQDWYVDVKAAVERANDANKP